MIVQDRSKVLRVPIDRIHANPAQPRKSFDIKELSELAESIRENGLLQPITVRKLGDDFEIVAGERRLRATKMAGFTTISCIVVNCDEGQSAIFAMLENIQRKDLEIFEEAEGLQRIISEWGITQEEAAQRLGKSQSTLANKLRLLRLTREQRRLICENRLTERHARALIRIEDEKERNRILNEIIEKKLNVSQTDALIDQYLFGVPKVKKPLKKRTFIVKDIRIFMNTIDRAVHTMKQTGIPVFAERNEWDDCMEYIIRIKKTKQ